MRTVRNITVAVEPELYRQTRKIAADYDTTVTDMVRFLLLALPEAAGGPRPPRRRDLGMRGLGNSSAGVPQYLDFQTWETTNSDRLLFSDRVPRKPFCRNAAVTGRLRGDA
jgi:hypothetical protein